MFDLIPQAYAQGAGASSSSPFGSFIFLGLLFAVFYFLMILPQQKRQKAHRGMVESLSKGDEVVTGGGMLGRIKEVGDQFLTVEVANNIDLKIQKHTVSAVLPKGTIKN